MSTATEVSALIERMLQEKTLSLDAMEGIQLLKKKAEAADAEIAKLKEQYAALSANYRTLELNHGKSLDDLKVLRNASDSVKAREVLVFKNELRAAVAEAQATAYRDSMKIVFAPNVVRENIMKYGSNNQNGVSYGTNEGGTVTRAEGYGEVEGNVPKTAL
jgi:hypothetical protein